MEGLSGSINRKLQTFEQYLRWIVNIRSIDHLPTDAAERINGLFLGVDASKPSRPVPLAIEQERDAAANVVLPDSSFVDDVDEGCKHEVAEEIQSKPLDALGDAPLQYIADARQGNADENGKYQAPCEDDEHNSVNMDTEGHEGKEIGSGEDGIDLTSEAAQEVREQTYVTFGEGGEDADDYTKGPARIVDASDGIVCCTALLLTLELSQAMQAAIQAQRRYAKAESEAEKRLYAIQRLRSKLSLQIDKTEWRLEFMSEPSDAPASNRQDVEDELSILKKMVEEYKLEREEIQDNLQFEAERYHSIQATANALLEEAWTQARLVEPEPVKSQVEEEEPEVDLQAEYRIFKQKLKDADELPSFEEEGEEAGFDDDSDFLKATKSPSQQAREDEHERLRDELWAAYDVVRSAQTQFDNRDEDRYAKEQARKTALERGEQPKDASSEAFDLRWPLHERDLTRALVEAEEAYHAATVAANEAGAVESYDQGSGDGGDDEGVSGGGGEADVEDGYAMSSEETFLVSVPVARIETWLANTPAFEEMLSPDEFGRSGLGDADEWSIAELDVGDSMSEIFRAKDATKRNSRRAKIDEMRKEQERLREQFDGMGV